jgi:hypothetical protein
VTAAIPVTIFTDVSSDNSIRFDVMADDLKQLSEFLNSKSIQVAFRMPGPIFYPTRWTNLIDIAVFVTRNILGILSIPLESPRLFLDLAFAGVYLRTVAHTAPRFTVLFAGFQKLVHIFEGDMTPAAAILCTIYKVYQLSLREAGRSIYGSQEMVDLLYRHIFSRFLNAQEGNLYRLLSLATPEGRLFYCA